MDIPQEGAGRAYCMDGRVTGTGPVEEGNGFVVHGPGGVCAPIIETAD